MIGATIAFNVATFILVLLASFIAVVVCTAVSMGIAWIAASEMANFIRASVGEAE